MRGIALCILLTAILFVAAVSPLWSQVTIVRTLPESGAHKAEAEWKSPTQPATIDREVPAASPGPRLSGRLIFGGYGSGGEETANIDDFTTDSRLDFNSYLGPTSTMDLSAEAYRKTGIDTFDQHYKGSMRYSSTAMSITLDGGYNQAETLGSVGETDVTEGNLGFDLAGSQDTRVPLELSYASTWTDGVKTFDESEDGTEKEETESHSFSLVSGLYLDRMALDLSGEGDIYHNRIDSVSSYAYGGTLGLRVPFTEIFSVYLGSTPSYSMTEHQFEEQHNEERGIKVETGLLVSMDETLEGDILLNRSDTWRSDPTYDTDDLSHTSLWGGSTSWKLQYPENLTSTGEYLLSTSSGKVKKQDLSADSIWQGEDGIIDRTGVNGRIRRAEGEISETGEERDEWGIFLTINPFDNSSIDSRYEGSRSLHMDGEGEKLSMQHDGRLDYSHTPAEFFSYGAGAAYGYITEEDYLEEDAVESTRYEGSSRLNIMPVIGMRRWDFGIAEQLEIEERESGRDYISLNTYSTALPIASMLRLRYDFSWEWVELASEIEEDGSAYTHSLGFSLSGGSVPVSFTSFYLIGHGFRGVRQQVDARLEVPVADSFSMISEMSYQYTEGTTYDTPYIFSVLLRYEF